MIQYNNNMVAINISHHLEQDQTKHVDINRYFIKEKFNERIEQHTLEKSTEQLTDAFFKGLSSWLFPSIICKLEPTQENNELEYD